MIHSESNIILLIDPDQGTENLLVYALKNAGLIIRRYDSAKTGLAAVPELNPKLIISEFITHDLNGIQLFNLFKSDPVFSRFQKIPFIFFSEEIFKHKYKDELLRSGLWGWFTKPFGAHEMQEVIENIFMDAEMFRNNQELRQEVKRSEYRYRDFIENANDLIFTLDENGYFTYLNNRFKALTGELKDNWTGRLFVELIHSDDREKAVTHYEMAHQGKARIFEARTINKNKEPVILSFNISPILERGKISGSIGIARDVTEQKMLEKEIIDLKNFNESIIQSMEAGLLTIDLSRNITSINSGAEKILQIKAAEVIGRPLKHALKPEEAEQLINHSQNPFSREMELTLNNLKTIAIGYTITDRIDDKREKVGTIISFRDISQIKQMQNEVMRMDRLASLGVLASGIAHEIKNPLAGIKALAQACDEEFEVLDPRREYLNRIVRQVDRLDSLLKTFFAFARPQPPDRKMHFLNEILKEVFNLVNKKMSLNQIQFKEVYPINLPAVMVDSQQIQQVFLNLFLNAIEAMPDGGDLTVKFRHLALDQNDLVNDIYNLTENGHGNYIEIIIEDSGHGIENENLSAIFDPFFTTKPSGLGLGLSIVYRIIQEHRGEIAFNSIINTGTTFTIKLPTGAV